MKKIIIFILLLLEILLNEFSLRSLSNDGEIDVNTINKIRFFNLIIFITIVIIYFYYDNFIKLKLLSKILVILIYIIFTDYISGYVNIGYKKVDKDAFRYIFPYDWIRGEPNQLDHNEFGFKGKPPNIKRDKNKFIIAFFGGSTGYNGNPTIAETLSKKLNNFNIDNEIINFSSVSSNHNQHLHRLLQFSEYTYDLIIFYGGGNETIQHYYYDPRPGYPYNFYFRNELSPIKQFVLKHSSILGEFDIYTGIISGKAKLVLDTKTENWKKKIINQYWRDLDVANNITNKLVRPSICKNSLFISITQPGNPYTVGEKKIWNRLKQCQNKNFDTWMHYDFTNENVKFKDTIHILQDSKNHIGKKISNIVFSKYKKHCN